MKDKEKIIGAIIILILSIVFIFSGYIISRDDKKFVEVDEIFSETNKGQMENKSLGKGEKSGSNFSEKQDEISEIVVDIKGEVKKPREYKLKEGSRVRDLIEKAGGLTKDANEELIHFSKLLKDEDCIIIYKNGEEIKDIQIGNSNNLALKDSDNGKVNINTADIDKLKTLQGIGDLKAKMIIEYREKNGLFKNVDELLNISGIGSKTLDKLRDNIDIR